MSEEIREELQNESMDPKAILTGAPEEDTARIPAETAQTEEDPARIPAETAQTGEEIVAVAEKTEPADDATQKPAETAPAAVTNLQPVPENLDPAGKEEKEKTEPAGETAAQVEQTAEPAAPRRGFFGRFFLCCVSFVIVCGVIGLAYYVLGMEPFGLKTVAVDDAKIQYIDFFTYYVDVLNGSRSITYDFANMLGGSSFGLFSYYLASPFNLLLIFFGKEGVYRFFNIAVALKLGTAGATFCWYLQRRFADRIRPVFVLALSMGYALMQYSIAQSSNIMWLDGIYMLPLIMLGVYEVLHRHSVWRLVLAVAFCILCNWYIAGVICLFSGIWFVFEFFMADREDAVRTIRSSAKKQTLEGVMGHVQAPRFQIGLTDFVLSFCRYVWGMGLGVALSAVLFLPTISAMRQGKGQYDNLKILFDISGDLLSSVRGYVIGTESARGHAALFCGGIAVFAAAAFFFSASVKLRQKIAFAFLAGICFLMLHWEPAMLAFSLMKRADSYWYRYGCLISFSLLYGAAAYLSRAERDRWTKAFVPILSLLYGAAVCKLNGIHLADLRTQGMQLVWANKLVFATAGASFALALLTVILLSVRPAGAGRVVRFVAGFLLLVITGAELWTNAQLIWKAHTDDTQAFYKEYSDGLQAQLAQLRKVDGGYYRIAQDRTRWHYDDDMTAYFNDSLAQNYWSNAAYTSSPEKAQLDLMWRLGYRDEAGCILIVRDPMLAADSFLGVKYMLQSTPVAGLEPVEEVAPFNGRKVYRNPYALPMAFVYDGGKLPTMRYDNAYVYQNELFSTLSGKDTTLFTPLTWTRYNEGSKSYFRVFVPEGNWLAYGNLLWPEKLDGLLSVNGAEPYGYACWTSPASFLIRSRQEQAQSTEGDSLQKKWEQEKEAAAAKASEASAAGTAAEAAAASGTPAAADADPAAPGAETAGAKASETGTAGAASEAAAAEGTVEETQEMRMQDLAEAAAAFDQEVQDSALIPGATSADAAENGYSDVRTLVFRTQKGLSFKDYQFFGLDLDALQEASQRIRSGEVTDLTMENGHVTCTTTGRSGQSLCLLVPTSKGWQVRRNGETVQADTVAGTMITVPLVDGENRIELNYEIPYLREGMYISAATFAVLLLDALFRWISRRRAAKRLSRAD